MRRAAELPASREPTADDADEPEPTRDDRDQQRKPHVVAVEQRLAAEPARNRPPGPPTRIIAATRGIASWTEPSPSCAATERAIQCCSGNVRAAAAKLQ